ncbi:MAG TPA: helix-turn-helix domain-containing protein, partial [Agromyces sp.]
MPSTTTTQIERHRSPDAAPLDGTCDVDALDVLDPDCPSRIVFGRIGERWSMFVILALAGGTMRFTQLRAKVGVVTPKVLTETLRAL